MERPELASSEEATKNALEPVTSRVGESFEIPQILGEARRYPSRFQGEKTVSGFTFKLRDKRRYCLCRNLD
jgi:hypothetical protein